MKDKLTKEICQNNLRDLKEKEQQMEKEIQKLRNEIFLNKQKMKSIHLHLNAFEIESTLEENNYAKFYC